VGGAALLTDFVMAHLEFLMSVPIPILASAWKDTTTWMEDLSYERVTPSGRDTVEPYPDGSCWTVAVYVDSDVIITRHGLGTADEAKAEADRLREHWMRT